MEKNMTFPKAIEITEKFKALCKLCHIYNFSDMEMYLEQISALGFAVGDHIPKGDLSLRKGAYMTNSNNKYKFNKDVYYIHWDNGNVGKYQFVRDDLYYEIDDEWEWFKNKMREGCLDYDPLNCHIVYDIETGLQKIKDYPDICKEMKEKIAIKSKEIEKKKLKQRLAELEREI